MSKLPPGVQKVAGLSGNVTGTQIAAALNLTAPAMAPFGTLAGQVADGGAVNVSIQAEAMARAAGDLALQNQMQFEINKSPVNLATLTPLPANSYSGGVLTAAANGALVVDGVTVTQLTNGITTRILVGGEANAAHNGPSYDVTAPGSPSTPWVLTRSSDSNTATLIGGACVQAESGTNYAGWGFMVGQAASAIALGTTAITFTARPLSVAAEVAARIAADDAIQNSIILASILNG